MIISIRITIKCKWKYKINSIHQRAWQQAENGTYMQDIQYDSYIVRQCECYD